MVHADRAVERDQTFVVELIGVPTVIGSSRAAGTGLGTILDHTL